MGPRAVVAACATSCSSLFAPLPVSPPPLLSLPPPSLPPPPQFSLRLIGLFAANLALCFLWERLVRAIFGRAPRRPAHKHTYGAGEQPTEARLGAGR